MSFQSNVIACPGDNCASVAGLSSDGDGSDIEERGNAVSVAVRVTPLYVAEIVTGVEALTVVVVIVKVALVAPAGIVTLAGTLATVPLLLESEASAPPLGAAEVNVKVPAEAFPPTTLEGLDATDDNVDVAGAARGVKLRTADQAPAVPAEFTARTRHQWRTDDRPLVVNWDAVTLCCATSGVVKPLESSIWIVYKVAFATSFQSSVTGDATVAALAGLSSVGADGVVACGRTASCAKRIESTSLAES